LDNPSVPELPEVEVLVRQLAPLIRGRKVRAVEVRRPKILAPTMSAEFERAVRGATIANLSRRGKYLLFGLRRARNQSPVTLVGHLGMTGRMYLLPRTGVLPKHAAAILDLGGERFVFEDTRYFGRLTLDTRAISRLGPEPLEDGFTTEYFAGALKRSSQAIKMKLLDQSVVAGVGNIYASEALFRAGVSPRTPARRLKREQIERLRRAIRETLSEAIECGSTVPLNFAGGRDGLFYYGSSGGDSASYEERLRVYDRAGKSCLECLGAIRRVVQAGRSTFYCPKCQK